MTDRPVADDRLTVADINRIMDENRMSVAASLYRVALIRREMERLQGK